MAIALLAMSSAAVPANADEHSRTVPAAISFGVSAVGLGVGIAAAILAFDTANDLKERCVDGHCFPEDEPQRDLATDLGALATVGFVVAGVGAAVGITLLSVPVATDQSNLSLTAGPRGCTLAIRFH